MTYDIRAKYCQGTMRLLFRKYPEEYGGGTALQLVDAETGESWATCTVNLFPQMPPEGHVYIKDWSENEGVLAELVRHGIVEDTEARGEEGWTDSRNTVEHPQLRGQVRYYRTGFVEAALCRLLVAPPVE